MWHFVFHLQQKIIGCFFFFLSFLPQTQKGIDLYFKLKLFFYQVTAPSEEEPANVDAATCLLSQL